MTPSVVPTAQTWILRFKSHRTTIFLHVDPLQQLSSIRAELLKALQQTCPDGHLNGIRIPSQASDILFARPVDANDLNAGWEAITHHSENADEFEDKKGKGKATVSGNVGRGRPGKDKIADTPQGVGLKDGGVVAFKFKSEIGGNDADESVDVAGGEELNGDTLVSEAPAQKWDVVVPSMEETYGDGEEEDGMIEPVGRQGKEKVAVDVR